MTQDRFLSRWSRRKAQKRNAGTMAGGAAGPAAGATTTAEAAEMPDVAMDETPGEPVRVVPDPGHSAEAGGPENSGPDNGVLEGDAAQTGEALTGEALRRRAEELGLPDPETLGPGSDFKQFMAPDIPKQLRDLALRRLWRSNPVLANLDGLVDYGEDFTDAARVVANMQTAYQVGRGYRRDEEEETDPREELETAEERTVEDAADAAADDTDDAGEDGETTHSEIAEVENPTDDSDHGQDADVRT